MVKEQEPSALSSIVVSTARASAAKSVMLTPPPMPTKCIVRIFRLLQEPALGSRSRSHQP